MAVNVLIEFLESRNTKVVRLSDLCTGRLYPTEDILVLISFGRPSQPIGHCAAERDKLMKNSDDPIGNRARDIPSRSAVPVPTAAHHTPLLKCDPYK